MALRQYNVPPLPQRQGMTFWEALWVLGLVALASWIAMTSDKQLAENDLILNSKIEWLCNQHPECVAWRAEGEIEADAPQ